MDEYKPYTTFCTICEKNFTYQRRVQIKGYWAGNWMGRERKFCSESCKQEAKNEVNKKRKSTANSKKNRKLVISTCAVKLGGVIQKSMTEMQALNELAELIDYAVKDEPYDEITVQTQYIDAVNGMLELGMINNDQQIKMLKIADKW